MIEYSDPLAFTDAASLGLPPKELWMDGEEIPEEEGESLANTPHDQNLADAIPQAKLAVVVSEIIQGIEDDLNSRAQWEKKLKIGVQQMGFDTEKKSFPFENASNAFSNAFRQAVYTFVANAVTQLLPAKGPGKVEIESAPTREMQDQALRIEKYFNLFATKIAEEYYPEKEQALLWVAIAGSVFDKTFYDPILKRAVVSYILPQDFIVNYKYSSLTQASRIVQRLTLTYKELKQWQMSGMYRDIEIEPSVFEEDKSVIGHATDKALGFNDQQVEEDAKYHQFYRLYECHVDVDIGEHIDEFGEPTGLPLPYIVTIDKESQKVLGFYRNWQEDDFDYKRIEYFTQLGPLFPGFGFYGFGYAHLCGGDAEASTAMLRQIIDAATLANFPGGLISANLQLDDNNIRVGPTEFVPVETGGTPLSDNIMMFPYKGPSAEYMQIQKSTDESIMQMSGITNQQLSEFNTNAPVGTTLALIQQAYRLQSPAIKRLYFCLQKEFKLIFNLFSQYLPDEPYPFSFAGSDYAIMRQDFQPSFNLIPVANPNISSNAQQLILAEGVLNNAKQLPEMHNMYNVLEYYYRELEVPNYEQLLIPPQQETPPPTDLVSTMMAIINGQPVQAFVWQDHMAYMTAVNNWMMQNQGNPAIPAAQAYVSQHAAFQYMLDMYAALGIQPPEDPSQLSPEQQNQIAMGVAQVSQSMAQQQQEAQPSQPIDPAIVGLEEVKVNAHANEVQEMANEQKFVIEQGRLALEEKKLELEHESKQNQFEKDLIIAQLKAEIESKNAELKAQVDTYKAVLQAETKAVDIHPDITLQDDVPIHSSNHE